MCMLQNKAVLYETAGNVQLYVGEQLFAGTLYSYCVHIF